MRSFTILLSNGLRFATDSWTGKKPHEKPLGVGLLVFEPPNRQVNKRRATLEEYERIKMEFNEFIDRMIQAEKKG